MRNLHLFLVLAASLLPFATAQAAPANLPETGQTTCTNAIGVVIACAGTGQDGERKAGVAWPNPRFAAGTGATAGCVTDNLTGLMWMGAPNSIPDTWANALASANGLMLCGFSDWRLPNVNELESLVNIDEESDQATFLNNTQGFSGVQAGYYWSSSSYAGSADLAWIVDMYDGNVYASDKSVILYVWPVRAGQPVHQ
jgi:hypothetical protein